MCTVVFTFSPLPKKWAGMISPVDATTLLVMGGGGGCEIFSPADSRNVKLVTDSGPVVLDVAGPADHPQLFVREDDAMAMAIRVVQNLLLLGHDKVFCGQPVWLKAWVFFDSPGDSPWADSWQTRSWALLDWS